MRLLRRTLIAVPVALVAVGLFAATSQERTWSTWARDTIDIRTFTGGEGVDEGLVTAVVVGQDFDQGELRITVSGDEAHSALDVSPADGSQEPGQVRDGYVLTRGLPNACEEGGADTDTDAPATTACTVRVRLRFEGRTGQFDDLRLTAAIGNYADVPAPEGSSFAVEVSYDEDPPAE